MPVSYGRSATSYHDLPYIVVQGTPTALWAEALMLHYAEVWLRLASAYAADKRLSSEVSLAACYTLDLEASWN